ncbi:hypothetical protein BU14_0771s0002 [Porphyra umbilicalis]|uniref:Uncharacterized protein n=1 Tax=Porphyra umbilicalis TaxID=2786 RepID=A0A1X6NP87_PORUM|nr:hypothetical protein BU14_0771s0002 [Porphyra umbilicalis]|eukprot:OSX70385.1 hypothetical protein BU14_0771s0002 [Porphyra umbilicalis]
MPAAGGAPRFVQRRQCSSACGVAFVPTPAGGDGALDVRGRSEGRSHRHQRRNTPTGVYGWCRQRRRGGLPRRAGGSRCNRARRDRKDVPTAGVPDAVVMPMPWTTFLSHDAGGGEDHAADLTPVTWWWWWW